MNHCKRLAVLWLLATLGLGSQASAATVAISPAPGTPTAMPRTQISFLGASAASLSAVSRRRLLKRRHSGRLRSYSSADRRELPAEQAVHPRRARDRARPVAQPPGQARGCFTSPSPSPSPGGAADRVPGGTPGTPADVQSFHSEPSCIRPSSPSTRRAGAAQRARLPVRRAVPRTGPVGPDDLRQRRQPRLVPPAARRTGRRRPAHAGLPRQERPHVVAGAHDHARLRARART